MPKSIDGEQALAVSNTSKKGLVSKLATDADSLADGKSTGSVNSPGCTAGNSVMLQQPVVAICPPTSTSFLDSLPSLVVSIIAIVLSLATLLYNRSKDGKARLQSIRDDFWIRKIVSPISIEPFLEYTQTLAVELPSSAQTFQEVEDYWASNSKKLRDFYLSFQVLSVVDEELVEQVLMTLENFEDVMANYCGALMDYKKNGKRAEPNRDECIQDCQAITFKIFKLIQKPQSEVGK